MLEGPGGYPSLLVLVARKAARDQCNENEIRENLGCPLHRRGGRGGALPPLQRGYDAVGGLAAPRPSLAQLGYRWVGGGSLGAGLPEGLPRRR